MNKTMHILKRKAVWGLILTCLITFFAHNRLITPDIMESRNIITAREMVYEGHWMVPTMNGDLRLEKPPLPTWLTALTEYIAPDSLALQRGMAGLAAILLVLYFYRFAGRVLRIKAWIPTLLLCTCYNVILMGRTASWDIYCHAFMMAGIYHFARGYRATSKAGWQFLAAGVWTALSILSKGPVSLYALFLPFLLSLRFLGEGSLKGKGKSVAMMAVVAVVLGGAWYAYIHWAEADALAAVAQKESGSWINHNVRPWYYYWKFFLEAGVWAVLLLTATVYPLLDRRSLSWREYRFSWLWMLLTLVLLSLLPEKKARYLLPLLIPACLTMGALLVRWKQSFAASSVARRAFRLNVGLLAAVVAVLPVAAWGVLYRQGEIGGALLAVYIVVAEGVAALLVFATRKLLPYRMVQAVTVLFLFAECAVLPAAKSLIRNTEAHSIAATRSLPELEGIPFYHAESDSMRIEIVYAAHRHIRPLDYTQTDSLKAHLPCALLTHAPIQEEVPPALFRQVDTLYIGQFDDNPRPKGNRRYTDLFRYHLTVLYPKGTIPAK
jgi:4-amino-4-deoxy-L-arabinose transferase-like glycosyltransferase